MIIHLFSILLIVHLTKGEEKSLQCGEWYVYKDEKCFKVFDNKDVKSYEDAKTTCYQNEGSSLVSIQSLEEQEFLFNKILAENNITNDVWIGAQYKQSLFKWNDNNTVNYTNWANDNPRNESGYECVVMAIVEPYHGKWLNEPCSKSGVVLCEKSQNWLFSYLQNTVMELRKSVESLQESVTILKKSESNLEETVSNLKQNLIPVGLIYVQFPGEKTPQEMWSWMTWQEITSSYAGLFFRAFGGNSSSFGSTQEANAPRITQIESHAPYTEISGNRVGSSKTVEGGWSEWIFSGGDYFTGNAYRDIRFYTSSGEIRPRNTAIRIWKRNA